MSSPHTPPPSTSSIVSKRHRRRLFGWLAAVGLVAGTLGLQTVPSSQAAGVGPLTVDDSGHWFEYAGSGEPYFMAGSGGPEGFLFYSDARKQEIVDDLIEYDVRAIYIQSVRSNGGDGGSTENPFNVSSNPQSGVNAATLDNWDSYLSQLDEAGITIWFNLYDDGARPFGACNPNLPQSEQDYVETIVERFDDYQHLVWLPTEELTMKACGDNATDVAKAASLAAEIRKHDAVHPVGVHHNNGQPNQFLGNTDIDVFAQQTCGTRSEKSVDGVHAEAEWGEDVYVMAECHPWHKTLLDAGERTTLRQSFWATVTGGGYMLFYDAWESNDPTPAMLADIGRINEFMDQTRFAEMAPNDQLAAGNTKWVLGNTAEDIYILYSNENPSTLGAKGLTAGTYRLRWFDPVDADWVDQDVNVDTDTVSFDVPNALGAEAVVYVERTGTATSPPTTTTTTVAPTTTTTTVAPTTTTTTVAPTTTMPGSNAVEITPIDDAYLQNSSGIDDDYLRVEAGDRERITYLRFDASAIGADATSLQLDLSVYGDAGTGTVTVFAGVDGTWSETSLDPTNAPARGDELASIAGVFDVGDDVTFDLDPSILDGDDLELIVSINGTGPSDVAFSSSEGPTPPTLRIGRSAPPPDPTTTTSTTTTTTPTTTIVPSTTTPTTSSTTTPTTTIAPTTTETTNTAPTDDAYLEGAVGFESNLLRVEDGARTRQTHLRFTLDTVPTSPTDVRLALTIVGDPGQGTLTVSEAVGGSWTETTLSKANAPSTGSVLATVTGGFSVGDVVVFQLPPAAIDSTDVELIVTLDEGGTSDVAFGASESPTPPLLTIISG